MPHSSPDIDEIRQSFDEARAAWPAIEVSFEAFSARLAGGGRGHASDLYLACALAEANPAALAAFDRRFLGEIRGVVAQIDRSSDFIAEVQQILRERLLVGPDAKIHTYRGRGPLAGWIRTAAIRTAITLRRSAKRELARAPAGDPAEAVDQLLAADLGPDIALLRRRHTAEIDSALRRAIAALEPAERELLQLYYVDGWTLARIAAAQHIGTATVFRRLRAASDAVLAYVKHDLVTRLALSVDGLDSLIRHVRDDLDLTLSQLLRGTALNRDV